MRNKKYELKTDAQELFMKVLAEKTGLTFDGAGDDRLFAKTIFTRSLELSEEKYAEMEKLLHKTKVKGKGFIAYAWNDSSGYEYWTKKQEENNYIQITVTISDFNKVDFEEISVAVTKLDNIFSKYSY